MNNHTDLQPNRCLQNRMSSGLRGRGLVTLSYSIPNETVQKYWKKKFKIYELIYGHL